MSGRVLLLRHMPGERVDRVSRMLEARGYQLDEANPAEGVPLPSDTSVYDAMVIYGGSQSVNDSSLGYLDDERAEIGRWLEADRPVLGICLGGQLIAQTLGARVAPHADGLHEIGYVDITPASTATDFMSESMRMYQWHNEGFEIPAEAELLATGSRYPNQAYRLGSNTYGFQFHPEVTPDIVQTWIDHTDLVNLPRPGMQPVDVQLADAAALDPRVDRWIDRFLDRWCGGFRRR